jgi:hypothetical protein
VALAPPATMPGLRAGADGDAADGDDNVVDKKDAQGHTEEEQEDGITVAMALLPKDSQTK